MHPFAEVRLRLGLTLHVDQKERVLSFEPDLCYQVYFVPLAGSNIREYFLVEQVERLLVNILTDIRKKQIQEFNEERRDQFFEDPVVIDHCGLISCHSTKGDGDSVPNGPVVLLLTARKAWMPSSHIERVIPA